MYLDDKTYISLFLKSDNSTGYLWHLRSIISWPINLVGSSSAISTIGWECDTASNVMSMESILLHIMRYRETE